MGPFYFTEGPGHISLDYILGGYGRKRERRLSSAKEYQDTL